MPDPALKSLTFDDVEKLEDRDGLRYELWDGQPVATTGGTPAHNLIALGLRDVIKPQLEPGCRVFVADVGLRLGESQHSNKAYPDVMVVCNPQPQTHQSNAILVAEVLSDNSVSRDRNRKFKAYAAQDSVQCYSLSEKDFGFCSRENMFHSMTCENGEPTSFSEGLYLILSQSAGEIEIYRRTNAWTEEIYRGAEATIEVPQPALRLPLREIYADVWTAVAGKPVP